MGPKSTKSAEVTKSEVLMHPRIQVAVLIALLFKIANITLLALLALLGKRFAHIYNELAITWLWCVICFECIICLFYVIMLKFITLTYRIRTWQWRKLYIYIYIYIYNVCVCVCVCNIMYGCLVFNTNCNIDNCLHIWQSNKNH